MSFYGKIYQEANSVSANGLSPAPDDKWIKIETKTTGEQTSATIKHELTPNGQIVFRAIGKNGCAYSLTIDAAGHIVSIIQDTDETDYLVSCQDSQGNITISPVLS